MATTNQRLHMRAVMDWLYAHRSHLLYPAGDQRTNRDAASWLLTEQQAEHLILGGGYVQWDCSETVPWIWKCAGCWRSSSPGYTGSHLEQLPVYDDPRHAGIGAGVVFGPGTGHHEAIVHTPDPHNGNPLLFSHGHPGADLVHLRDMQSSQTAEGYPGVRMLSIAHL